MKKTTEQKYDGTRTVQPYTICVRLSNVSIKIKIMALI